MSQSDKPSNVYRGGVRHTATLWLLLGGIINYVDRSSLSIAAPEMVRELHLSMTQIGLLGTVFAWCYAIAQIPTGWVGDRVSARTVFAVSLGVWSVATMATGFVGTLGWLLVFRGLLGVAEAPCWPTATKIISFWYPRHERGVAIGIFTSSAKWGPAIAPPILIALMIQYGWRGLFIATGAAGILYAVIFYVGYRNPDGSRHLGESERRYIEASGGGTEHRLGSSRTRIRWASLFSLRSVLGMIAGYFCAIWIWNSFIVFLPLYLHATFHVSLAKLGIYASIPWIGGALGAMSSGFVTRLAMTRFALTSKRATQIVIAVYSVGAAIALSSLTQVHELDAAIAIVTIALAFTSAINSLAWALAAEIAPAPMVSSVSSIQNFGGYLGGALSPLVTGAIVDATGSYSIAFSLASVVGLLGGACYLWWVKNSISEEEASTVFDLSSGGVA